MNIVLDLIAQMSPLAILGVLVAAALLIGYLLYLLLKKEKGGEEKKEGKEKKKEQKEQAFEKEIVGKNISLDPKIVRLQTHFLSVLRSLTIDAKELGFTYDSDTIQTLLADGEKVFDYYLKNPEFEKSDIPFLPCIPTNQHNPRQLMETLFHNGSLSGLCSVDIQKLENTITIPKKPYWIFGVTFSKTEPDKLFLQERRFGLAINELIFASCFAEDLWRNRSTQIFSIITMMDRVPLVFKFNLAKEVPEIKAFSEKESVRDYYLGTCKDRVCFAE